MSSEDKSIGNAKRRSHRKSRTGCINCKRRKVKCDELRPECTKCVQFGLCCRFAGDLANSEPLDFEPPATSPRYVVSRPRGRGRPRKNWALDPGAPMRKETALPSTASVSESGTHTHRVSDLNVDEAELLLHFTQVTALKLVDTSMADDPMPRFWAYSLPRIGLTHHFVLHLAYALAAYHIAHQDIADDAKNMKYRRIGEHHASAGLRQLTAALACIDNDNCGAAYIAATLVCYCTFAAGPTGPGDLLACNLDARQSTGWYPLIHGVRLIRENFEEDILFSGFMEPFKSKRPKISQPESETSLPAVHQARCYREGFKRLDWEEPLRDLRAFVASQTFADADICLRELDGMILNYEATYGDESANFECSSDNQFIFGWLYRLTQPFINCLQRRNPTALVMLAYYAVLLRTVEHLWYMEGWSGHLLATVTELVDSDHVKWLRWPAESLRRKNMY